MVDAAGPYGMSPGRRVLVTGASQGIGAAVASEFAAAGSRLVVSARDGQRLESLAVSLRESYGAEVTAVNVDLIDTTEVERLAREALRCYGGLDVVVNNAGVSIPEPVTQLAAESWTRTMNVNLRAPALLCARIGSAMVSAGRGGKIVNISSAAGKVPLADHYAYSTSKAGLAMATRMLALELGPYGIQANAVSPTVVMTEMGQRVWGDPETAAPLLQRVPAGHFAAVSDVVRAVLFLASPESSMINGVDLAVDGGYAET